MNPTHALTDFRSERAAESWQAPAGHSDADGFRASSRMLWVILFGIGTIFFLNEHDLTTSLRDQFSKSIEQQSASVASGDSLRKICYLSLAGLGGILLIRRRGRQLDYRNPFSILIASYLLYCICSVAWSIDPGLTVRRLAVLLLSIIGVFGVSRQLGVRDLLRIALFICGTIILIGLGAEIALGTFRPWSGDYRFSGTVHPNSQAGYCAILVLAAYCSSKQEQGWKRKLLLAVLTMGLLLLVLTKSRTGLGAMLIGLIALWYPFSPAPYRAAFAVSLPFFSSAVLLVAALRGYDVVSLISRFTFMGRAEQVASFSGRVPLWQELVPYASNRPFLGHGYSTFWNAHHIDEISSIFQWTIPNAHNELLDSVLNIGILGTLLLMVVVLMGLFRTGAAYLRTGDPGLGFVFSLVVFGMLVSMFESGFSHPVSFESFVAACGITLVAFCNADRRRPPATSRLSAPSTSAALATAR